MKGAEAFSFRFALSSARRQPWVLGFHAPLAALAGHCARSFQLSYALASLARTRMLSRVALAPMPGAASTYSLKRLSRILRWQNKVTRHERLSQEANQNGRLATPLHLRRRTSQSSMDAATLSTNRYRHQDWSPLLSPVSPCCQLYHQPRYSNHRVVRSRIVPGGSTPSE